MNTPRNESDLPLEKRARALYLEAARRIDPATAARLRTARRQALESTHSAAFKPARWLLPAGACAAIALAAMTIWQPAPQHRAGSLTQTAGVLDGNVNVDNELPPDADQTDPNLYQNLDFYDWLAANNSQPTTDRTP
ncbi:MAG TPA: hypothetical protein VN043_03015 [Rhodanobacter sp.]|nr:hypothetical protein [Rhodanobacter sp.]